MGKEMCSAKAVTQGTAFFRTHTCTRSASVQRGGKWYCGQHDPDVVAARKAARNAADEAKYTAIMAENRLKTFAPSLLSKLKLARAYVADAASAKAPLGSGPRIAHELLIEIDATINKAEGKN